MIDLITQPKCYIKSVEVVPSTKSSMCGLTLASNPIAGDLKAYSCKSEVEGCLTQDHDKDTWPW